MATLENPVGGAKGEVDVRNHHVIARDNHEQFGDTIARQEELRTVIQTVRFEGADFKFRGQAGACETLHVPGCALLNRVPPAGFEPAADPYCDAQPSGKARIYSDLGSF